MTTYNGYRNWTVWNVNLWVNNDEPVYKKAFQYCHKQGKDQAGLLAALVRDSYGKTTPDGAQLRHMAQADWDELAESFKD